MYPLPHWSSGCSQLTIRITMHVQRILEAYTCRQASPRAGNCDILCHNQGTLSALLVTI